MLYVLISLGALIAIVLLAGLFMKKDYSLSSEVIIHTPQKEVFEYVKQLRNQEKYSKWVMADPNVKLTYTGTDGTLGFRAAWDSADKNVGAGEQEITKILNGEGYDVEIRFERPFKGISYANTRVSSVSAEKSKVVNTFNTRTPFPMNIMVPLLKNMLQKDMDGNMQRLKNNLESKA